MSHAIPKSFAFIIPVTVLCCLLAGCSSFKINNTPKHDKDIPSQEERLKTTGR